MGTKAKFIYDITLWSEDGNTMLERKRVNVVRVRERSAREYLISKYPRPYSIELVNLINLKK